MSALIGLVILALDIWAIVDILKSAKTTGNKALWILLVVILPVVGMIIYFVLRKNAQANS